MVISHVCTYGTGKKSRLKKFKKVKKFTGL